MPSDKSKAVAANVSNSRNVSHNAGKFRSDIKSLTVENQDVKKRQNFDDFGITPKPGPRRKCFRCGSFSHMIANCPEKGRLNGAAGETRAKISTNTSNAQVNRCQVDRVGLREPVANGRVGLQGPAADGELPVMDVGLSADSLASHTPCDKQQVADSAQQVADSSVDFRLADGWSQLHYIHVDVRGLSEPISALHDSGAQLCCVDSAVIESLNLPKLGHVMLKGLNADLVHADLVCLHVKLSDANVFYYL